MKILDEHIPNVLILGYVSCSVALGILSVLSALYLFPYGLGVTVVGFSVIVMGTYILMYRTSGLADKVDQVRDDTGQETLVVRKRLSRAGSRLLINFIWAIVASVLIAVAGAFEVIPEWLVKVAVPIVAIVYILVLYLIVKLA